MTWVPPNYVEAVERFLNCVVITWVTLSVPVAGILPVQPGALARQCGHDLGHPSTPFYVER